MKLIPDNSIDLIVTSPLYDEIRDYKGFSLDLHKKRRYSKKRRKYNIGG